MLLWAHWIELQCIALNNVGELDFVVKLLSMCVIDCH